MISGSSSQSHIIIQQSRIEHRDFVCFVQQRLEKARNHVCVCRRLAKSRWREGFAYAAQVLK